MKLVGSFLAAFAVGIWIGSAGVANAHSAATWYPSVWGPGSLTDINFKYNDQFPTGAWRNRIEDAVTKWNDVQPNQISFQSLPNDNSKNYSADCSHYSQEEDVVYYLDFGQSFYGWSPACYLANGNIKQFVMVFNSYWNWNRQTSDPGNTEIDALSTAVHEFGHAGGFYGHFSDTSAGGTCPLGDYSGWQTMCDSVGNLTGGTDNELGKKFRRTLESHDEHTFDNAYGP